MEQQPRQLVKQLAAGVLLMVLRVALVAQPGLVHPDEFFQAGEIVAGDILGVQTDPPWEASLAAAPYRSVAVPALLVGVPLRILRALNLVTPLAVLVAPRFVMVALSLGLDLSLWRLCASLCVPFHRRWLLLASSHAMLVLQVRTFSNAVESVLVALSWLVVLSPKPSAVVLGALTAVGCFARITFPIFVLPLWLLAWINFGQTRGLVAWTAAALLGFVPISAVCIAVDSALRPGWHLAPLNNLLYNINAGNLALHGLHPRWTHVLVNGFLLFGPLWLFVVNDLGRLAMGVPARSMRAADEVGPATSMPLADAPPDTASPSTAAPTAAPTAHSLTKSTTAAAAARLRLRVALTASWVLPLVVLTLAPHQEPRFLLPMAVALVALYGHRIHFPTWLLLNMAAVAFWGGIHQSGIAAASHFLLPIINTHRAGNANFTIHAVFSHGYRLPLHLLAFAPSSRLPNFVVHNLGSVDEKAIWAHLQMLTRQSASTELARCSSSAQAFAPTVLVLVMVPTLVVGALDFAAHGFRHAGPLPGLHWSSESPPLLGMGLPDTVRAYLWHHLLDYFPAFLAGTPASRGPMASFGHGLKMHVFFRYVQSLRVQASNTSLGVCLTPQSHLNVDKPGGRQWAVPV